MLSRLMGLMMKLFNRKNMHEGRDAKSGERIAQDEGVRSKSGRTYASQDDLKRSVVKVVKDHRQALEWLADK